VKYYDFIGKCVSFDRLESGYQEISKKRGQYNEMTQPREEIVLTFIVMG
jgi:hypothetical protein